jgi:hypothetical protein
MTIAAQVRATMKAEYKKQPFAAASKIVKDAIRQHLHPEAPYYALSQPSALARASNQMRQGLMPQHLRYLESEMREDIIAKDFLIADSPLDLAIVSEDTLSLPHRSN